MPYCCFEETVIFKHITFFCFFIIISKKQLSGDCMKKYEGKGNKHEKSEENV